MSLHKIFVISLLILSPFVGNAQYYEPEKKAEANSLNQKSFKDKLHFGGSLGLQFGSFTSIYIAPIVFYDVTNQLMVGAGVNYIYQKYDYGNTEYTSSIYGPKLAAIFKPFKQLILSTEYEYNFYDRNYDYYGNDTDPYWFSTWYVGLGYGIAMGKGGGVYVSMSYDLLYDPSKSYYSSAWRPTIGAYF
jgi:hypothetical protein